MSLGKQVRKNRLYNKKSGRILVIALDHAIGWGVIPGIDDIYKTMEKMIEAQPDAITMLKGTAERVFGPYAGSIPFIMKATTFSPYQPAYDTAVGAVDEAVRLGADAIAAGATVCLPDLRGTGGVIDPGEDGGPCPLYRRDQPVHGRRHVMRAVLAGKR